MDFVEMTATQLSSPNRPADIVVKPDFLYGNHKDLVTKGGELYAYWNGTKWSRSTNELVRSVDRLSEAYANELMKKYPGRTVIYKSMAKNSTDIMRDFSKFTKLQQPKDVQFNQRIIFSNEEMKREDYATAQLGYYPIEGPTNNFDTLMGRLYDEEEFEKIMWTIGLILTGQTYKVQKMLFLYGEKGSGKGSIISIIKKLVEGYYGTVNLDLLTSNNPFATSGLEELPVLVDDDADASHIQNDTNLLKLTAHETVIVNNKYKSTYPIEFQGILIAASNKTLKIRDVDAGLVRRLIEVRPTGNRWSPTEYRELMKGVKFEIPAIAYKCMEFVNRVGVDYYEDYIPIEMMEDTDMVFSFMRQYIMDLGDPVTLNRASALYASYIEEFGWDSKGAKKKMKDELPRYYHTYSDRTQVNGNRLRNVYSGIRWEKIFPTGIPKEVNESIILKGLNLENQASVLDEVMKDYPAQLTNSEGYPLEKWDDVKTTLKDIDTHELHYVRVPLNHIVLDFDIKDENGEKDLAANIEAALEYPATYAEVSKSGKGIHLHYYYEGNINTLARSISKDIEIKVFSGKASLRRKLSLCNSLPMATLTYGLPQKEESKKVYREIEHIVNTEKTLRRFIKRQLGMDKDHPPSHEHTTPTIMFISSELHKAYDAGVEYDLNDLKHSVFMRALQSTHNKEKCLKIFKDIPWSSMRDEDNTVEDRYTEGTKIYPKEELVFYDVEVYPNLFIVVWKKYGEDEYVKWVNPTPEEIEYLCTFPLVGFNNRRYDNHILYARILGGSNYELFTQSTRIINEKNAKTGMYAAAYELSYTDIYEYSQKKQSLKKWQVEMGIDHVEMEIPWDQPVSEDMVPIIVEYCTNDVLSTEKLFDHIYQDYVAREILATITGGSMNATNNMLTAKFIFGNDPRPQDKFIYVNLSETFPGYEYKFGKSTYRGVEPGEGGYVYAKPGVYKDVGLMDVESMHPNSLINMNYFGPYTARYKSLLDVRLSLKHNEIDILNTVFDGKLKQFVSDPNMFKPINTALKIVINSVYGMTSAKFDNKFKHKDNVDNVVAKRGALFMIDLRFYMEEKDYEVIHIKTDSIKIANFDDRAKKLIDDFGNLPKYNYKFEHEDTYSRMALINNAVYIAQSARDGHWSRIGTEFRHEYSFKKIWSKEDIIPEDFYIVKQSIGHIYLGDRFIGKVGSIYASLTGDEAKYTKDGESFNYLSETKGFLFRPTDEFKLTDVDMSFYDARALAGLKKIAKVGDVNQMVDDMPIEYKEMLNA